MRTLVPVGAESLMSTRSASRVLRASPRPRPGLSGPGDDAASLIGDDDDKLAVVVVDLGGHWARLWVAEVGVQHNVRACLRDGEGDVGLRRLARAARVGRAPSTARRMPGI